MSVHTDAVHRVAAAPFARACLYYTRSSAERAAASLLQCLQHRCAAGLQLADREGQLSALREEVARMAAEIARLNEQARTAASLPPRRRPPSKPAALGSACGRA